MGRDEDSLDEALTRLADTGPEYAGGLANHGPMAAEALVALGRADAVARWVDGYRRHLDPPPAAGRPISESSWREALGDISRAGDWARFFAARLQEASWRVVLEQWAPRLAPGLVGAATHGIIRTSHAVRALAARDTPPRRREFAEGLAYWAARFQRLPEAPPPPKPQRGLPSRMLRVVPTLPDADRRSGGLITDRLEGLEGFGPFSLVADLADTSGDASVFLSDLTLSFARVYLEQAPNRALVIAFIHAVTGPAAVRRLLPHLTPAATRPLLRYAWQAAAGLYAAMARPMPEARLPETVPALDELIEGAVRADDEHAFKFTEVCLREHEERPDPIYLAAAADALLRL
jgi:hypothetical protein